MSEAQFAARTRRQDRTARKATVEDEQEIGTLLGALEDDDCRRILAATSEEALSASEVAETCDIPASTVYRKLDRLTDLDLLREGTRISRDGTHASEYAASVADLQLTVDDGGVELTLSRDADEADAHAAW